MATTVAAGVGYNLLMMKDKRTRPGTHTTTTRTTTMVNLDTVGWVELYLGSAV